MLNTKENAQKIGVDAERKMKVGKYLFGQRPLGSFYMKIEGTHIEDSKTMLLSILINYSFLT